MTRRFRPPLLLRPALRRFWLVPVVLGAMGAAVGDDVDLRQVVLHQASAVYVVTTGSVNEPSVLAVDANSDRLSRTYALVLGQDQQLLGAVGAQLGETADAVRSSLDARFVPGSASIIVTYADPNPAKVDRFFEVFTDYITEQPATPNLVGGLIRPVRLPQAVQPLPTGIDVDWRLGALAGLLAGLGVAVVAERAAPRLHDVDHLQLLTGSRVVGRVGVRLGDTGTLVRLIAGRHAGDVVAVVGLEGSDDQAATAVAAQCLRRAQQLAADGAVPVEAAELTWLPFASGQVELLAQSTPRTTPVVLLVPRGRLVRRLEDQFERLTELLPDRSFVLALVDEPLPRRDRRDPGHRVLVGR